MFCSSITLTVPFALCFLSDPLSPFWRYCFAKHGPLLFKYGPTCAQSFSFSWGCIKTDYIWIGPPYWTVQNPSFCLSCLYVYHSASCCVIYQPHQQQFFSCSSRLSMSKYQLSYRTLPHPAKIRVCALALYHMAIACAYIDVYVLSLFKSSLKNIFAFGNWFLEDLAISESCERSFYWDRLGH